MNINLRYGSLLAALAASVSLHAQVSPTKPIADAPTAPAIDFTTVDKDADGRLSKEEALSVAELRLAFDVLDVDHDKFVTPAEFSSWSRASKAKVVAKDPATAPGGSAGAQHMPTPQ